MDCSASLESSLAMTNDARVTLAAGLLALVTLSACREEIPYPHTSLATSESLRVAFNADSGKVRAIFLASPT